MGNQINRKMKIYRRHTECVNLKATHPLVRNSTKDVRNVITTYNLFFFLLKTTYNSFDIYNTKRPSKGQSQHNHVHFKKKNPTDQKMIIISRTYDPNVC